MGIFVDVYMKSVMKINEKASKRGTLRILYF